MSPELKIINIIIVYGDVFSRDKRDICLLKYTLASHFNTVGGISLRLRGEIVLVS